MARNVLDDAVPLTRSIRRRLEARPAPDDRELEERAEELWRAISRLDEGLFVLALHWKCGLSFVDIGRSIGVSKQRAHQLYAKALARLRELLEGRIS